MSLESEVLHRIKPSPDEERRIQEAVASLTRAAAREAEARGIGIEPLVVGSIAKGTHLKDPDIDLFLMFPTDVSREVLEKKGLELGYALLQETEERYAEHPYVRGVFQGFECDVVPCYKVAEATRRMSAVDRTPFHTAYVRERLSEPQKDEARLLKAFQKGIGVYGAHVEVEGFPGYLCELLVLHYGSFLAVVEAAARWKKGVRMDPTGEGDENFPQPLTFIDPVDPHRNVASALSAQNFVLFAHACKEYLAGPSANFFFPPERPVLTTGELRQRLEERDTALLGVSIRRPGLVDDILFSQVKKAVRAVSSLLERQEFAVMYDGYWVDGSLVILLFELQSDRLPKARLHKGPPALHEEAKNFVDKWRDHQRALSAPFIMDGRWCVDAEREYTEAARFLEERLLSVNLGKNLNESAGNGYEVLDREKLLEGWPPAITVFLDRRFPWEK